MGFRTVTLMVTVVLATGEISSRAQDAGPVLDLLVRKKIITDQEAEEVRAELTKQFSETSGGKWKLSAPINELELYGDARFVTKSAKATPTATIRFSEICRVTVCVSDSEGL
jgi:hypothetical protein